MAADTTIEQRLATLEAGQKILERLEQKTDELTQLVRQIAALEHEQRAHSSALERAFKAIEATERKCEEREQGQQGRLDKVWSELGRHHDDLDALDDRIAEWINKGKGAWFAASFLWGGIQVAVLAVVGWVFSEINLLHDRVLVLEHHVTAQQPAAGHGPREEGEGRH